MQEVLTALQLRYDKMFKIAREIFWQLVTLFETHFGYKFGMKKMCKFRDAATTQNK